MAERFSDRHGHCAPEQQITIRDDAPEGLRFAIPLIAQDAGMSPKAMRRIICQILLVPPDPSNWSEYPNVWEEVNGLIQDCPWFKVYDIAEAIHCALSLHYPDSATDFQGRLNQYFLEKGIGWQITNGQIVYRGSEVFTDATREAAEVLGATGRSAAANEIHEPNEALSPHLFAVR